MVFSTLDIFAAQFRGCGFVDVPVAAILRDNHAIIALSTFGRHIAFDHIGEHPLGIAQLRIAETAAARGVEAKHVARSQRIVGVASRQMLLVRRFRIDDDVAGASFAAARSTKRGNDVFGRADGKPRVREVEIFAPYPETAAEFARPARILDQLEAQHASGEFALDDLDGADLGVALIDGGARGAVLARAASGAAAYDLVLHI